MNCETVSICLLLLQNSQYDWCVAHRFFHRRLRSLQHDMTRRRTQLSACLCHTLQSALQSERDAKVTAVIQESQSRDYNTHRERERGPW